jgi:predicted metal-dependent phosphoesterase TrpH
MVKYPNGNWIKGLVHLHSKYSDGHLKICELAERARELKYNFMVVTDHGEVP